MDARPAQHFVQHDAAVVGQDAGRAVVVVRQALSQFEDRVQLWRTEVRMGEPLPGQRPGRFIGHDRPLGVSQAVEADREGDIGNIRAGLAQLIGELLKDLDCTAFRGGPFRGPAHCEPRRGVRILGFGKRLPAARK